MANFIVQFPLKTEKYQEEILDRRFEIGRQMYNALVNVTQKRYKEMIKTKQYRNLLSLLLNDKKKDKNIKKKHSREWIQKRKERLLITEKRQKE